MEGNEVVPGAALEFPESVLFEGSEDYAELAVAMSAAVLGEYISEWNSSPTRKTLREITRSIEDVNGKISRLSGDTVAREDADLQILTQSLAKLTHDVGEQWLIYSQ